MVEVVAALIWRENHFLICQRPANKARGLLWEFVGGKVEPGETMENALIRECKEELNITVSVEDLFLQVIHEYPDIHIRLSLFHCHLLDGEPEMIEHHDLKWITPDQIHEFDFCPADTEILQRIQKDYC